MHSIRRPIYFAKEKKKKEEVAKVIKKTNLVKSTAKNIKYNYQLFYLSLIVRILEILMIRSQREKRGDKNKKREEKGGGKRRTLLSVQRGVNAIHVAILQRWNLLFVHLYNTNCHRYAGHRKVTG